MWLCQHAHPCSQVTRSVLDVGSSGGGSFDGNGVYYQTDSVLAICWGPPGFSDGESGVWVLEWQVSRLVIDQISGDESYTAVMATQQLASDDAKLFGTPEAGALNITQQDLIDASGGNFFAHPNRLRIGVRAINRAGLSSCGDDACVVQPCTCANSRQNGGADDWSTTSSIEAQIDIDRPLCNDARAWLCDPSASSLGGASTQCSDISLVDASTFALGDAANGFQSNTSALRVQWEGFVDTVSGVARCEVDAIEYAYPGEKMLGEQCSCAVFDEPACDCAPSAATDEPARCVAATDALRAIAQSQPDAWRYSNWLGESTVADEFLWTSTLLAGEEVTAVCVPSETYNVGSAAISEGCSSDVECAPLTASALGYLHPWADTRVLCIQVDTLPWLNNPFASTDSLGLAFCCGAGDASAICLPAAWADAWASLSPPPSFPPGGAPPLSPSPVPPSVQPPLPPAAPAACSVVGAIPIEVRIDTSASPLAIATHVSWDIDGVLTPSADDCSPELCSHASSLDCGCLYERRDAAYSHLVCLSPGTHWLHLHDASGLGWLGSKLTLYHAGSDARVDSDEGYLVRAYASDYQASDDMANTIDSPVACRHACSTSTAASTCLDQIFATENNLCSELAEMGCACDGCCLRTAELREELRGALDLDAKSPLLLWTEPSRRTLALTFEVYDTSAAQRQRPPPPPAQTVIASMSGIECNSSGYGGVVIPDLDLHHRRGYAASVRAFDRAGNEVACGGSGRGRYTTDGTGQRTVVIDATPPERPDGLVYDVDLTTDGVAVELTGNEAGAGAARREPKAILYCTNTFHVI